MAAAVATQSQQSRRTEGSEGQAKGSELPEHWQLPKPTEQVRRLARSIGRMAFRPGCRRALKQKNSKQPLFKSNATLSNVVPTDGVLISYKYIASNHDVLAPHIYNATGERPPRPIGETLRPPLPGRKEDPARSPFPARDAQKQFT
jgi:hypothetical protein